MKKRITEEEYLRIRSLLNATLDEDKEMAWIILKKIDLKKNLVFLLIIQKEYGFLPEFVKVKCLKIHRYFKANSFYDHTNVDDILSILEKDCPIEIPYYLNYLSTRLQGILRASYSESFFDKVDIDIKFNSKLNKL